MYADPTHNYCGISKLLQIVTDWKRRIYVKFDRNPNTNFEYDGSVVRLITSIDSRVSYETNGCSDMYLRTRMYDKYFLQASCPRRNASPPKERVP